MTNIVQAQSTLLLQETLGISSPTLFTGQGMLKLTTTAPTSTAAGTELTGGSGYTTGGSACNFTISSPGQATGPLVALSWTNASGGSWSIVGAELWDSAVSPLRWWWGLFSGQPIVVANGNIFSISIAGITVTLG
jgi:hypothetical protein